MKNKNPDSALAVFNAPDAPDAADVATVHELTLGIAGILEAIGSPLYSGSKPESIAAWAPTLFAMTQPPAESRRILALHGRDHFERLATDWADRLPLATARRLIEGVTATLTRLSAVSLSDGEDGAAGNPTAAGPTAG